MPVNAVVFYDDSIVPSDENRDGHIILSLKKRNFRISVNEDADSIPSMLPGVGEALLKMYNQAFFNNTNEDELSPSFCFGNGDIFVHEKNKIYLDDKSEIGVGLCTVVDKNDDIGLSREITSELLKRFTIDENGRPRVFRDRSDFSHYLNSNIGKNINELNKYFSEKMEMINDKIDKIKEQRGNVSYELSKVFNKEKKYTEEDMIKFSDHFLGLLIYERDSAIPLCGFDNGGFPLEVSDEFEVSNEKDRLYHTQAIASGYLSPISAIYEEFLNKNLRFFGSQEMKVVLTSIKTMVKKKDSDDTMEIVLAFLSNENDSQEEIVALSNDILHVFSWYNSKNLRDFSDKVYDSSKVSSDFKEYLFQKIPEYCQRIEFISAYDKKINFEDEVISTINSESLYK